MLRDPDLPADSIPLADLREDALNVRVLRSGKKAILIRRGSEVQVFGEVCPHMGADLSEARYCAREGTLQCHWHGYLYGVDDGRFLENPNEKTMTLVRKPSAHYRPELQPRLRLPVIPFTVKDGRVVLGRDHDLAGGDRA